MLFPISITFVPPFSSPAQSADSAESFSKLLPTIIFFEALDNEIPYDNTSGSELKVTDEFIFVLLSGQCFIRKILSVKREFIRS